MFDDYLKRMFKIARKGDAREESFYSTLEKLLYSYADVAKLKKIDVTVLPKKTEAGNPDFRVWDGQQHIVGYIEAKTSDQDLDYIQETEQLERYRGTFPNLILTNFLEFRLYRDGALIDSVQIGKHLPVHDLKAIPPVENSDRLLALFEKFFAFSLPKSYTAKSLAVELAKRTRFLKEQVLVEELAQETKTGNGELVGFMEAFKTFLIGGITLEDFADLYAQTITYGLFAARSRAKSDFTRKIAFDNIPPTIGILRDVFRFVSYGDMPKQMESIVDDISEVLAIADVNKILSKYFHEGKGRDPVVHFYETFLAEYDPKTREKRGVYYTPEPVVSYIVRSLHQILKDYFGQEDGFATSSVRVLDPAAGTLTFLAEAAKLAATEFENKYGEGGKKELIHDHILNDFYAFELMMAPYAIGHLKMAFLLEELGYRLKPDERFKLYLTNTLEMKELEQSKLPGMSSLSEESRLAGIVKKETPILVVLGNPPYSGHSTNIGPWITDILKDYYKVDGKPLGEKNTKWLQDDYVKFIRFAQWKIEQTGSGVLGFITNHAWLDSPTFRGMRASILKTFDEIYILNLHGSTLMKEKTLKGSKDENVFDIQPGVAITLAIKSSNLKEKKVFCADRRGLRNEKYSWLNENDILTTKWKAIKPSDPYFFLVVKDEASLKRYMQFSSVKDIFPSNSTGIQTHRDNFIIDIDSVALKQRLLKFWDTTLSDEAVKQMYGLRETKAWKVSEKRKTDLSKNENWDKKFTKILYRSFDERWIFYDKNFIDRPRQKVMTNMMASNNLLLLVPRRSTQDWQHAFVTDKIAVDVAISASSREANQTFPLFIDSQKEKHAQLLLGEQGTPGHRKPNISKEFLELLNSEYDSQITLEQKEFHGIPPEQIFHYIYGVLYSPAFRKKYTEFLRIDFPRIPLTKDAKVFEQVGNLGKRLVDLHLVRSKELDKPTTRFHGDGDNLVEKPTYSSGDRVYINKTKYFEPILAQEWNYQIGGYQVLEKWLKDRKGRHLTADDIRHYCRVATAIKCTIEIQNSLDKLYPKVEGTLITKIV